MWKNFATVTRFMVLVLRRKIDWISLDNSSSIPARHVTSGYCKSGRLIIIQKTGIPLATIRGFIYKQNWKHQAYKSGAWPTTVWIYHFNANMAASVYRFISFILFVVAINWACIISQINSSVFSYMPKLMSKLQTNAALHLWIIS